MVVQITTAFPSVLHVLSDFGPDVTGFHLLCYCVSARRCSPVLVTELSISILEPGRKHHARPYHIDSAVEYTMRRTCFPPGFRWRARCFPYVLHLLMVHFW
jgi:hypothetical protein